MKLTGGPLADREIPDEDFLPNAATPNWFLDRIFKEPLGPCDGYYQLVRTLRGNSYIWIELEHPYKG